MMLEMNSCKMSSCRSSLLFLQLIQKRRSKDYLLDATEEDKEADGPSSVMKFWECMHKGFSPFFWFLNHVLVYISDLNYGAVALRSLWFFQSGRLIKDIFHANPVG